MPRTFPVNTFSAAWNHYKQHVLSYTCDDGVIELRYEDSNNGNIINVVINYLDTNNPHALHQMLKLIIDDLPIDSVAPYGPIEMGTIIFKGYAREYEAFGLHLFTYKNRKFEIQGNDCVMIHTPPEDE
jgi:hypothetical protein